MDITHMWGGHHHHRHIIITISNIDVIGAKNKRPTSWPNGRRQRKAGKQAVGYDPRLNGNLYRQAGTGNHVHTNPSPTSISTFTFTAAAAAFCISVFFKTFFFSFSFLPRPQIHRWRSCGWGLREGCDSYADFVAQKEEETVEIV